MLILVCNLIDEEERVVKKNKNQTFLIKSRSSDKIWVCIKKFPKVESMALF